MDIVNRPPLKEERLNALTHAVAAGVAWIVLSYIFLSRRWDQPLELAILAAHGISMCFVFTSSVFYHTSCHKRARVILRAVDKGTIYLFIAGTATPMLAAWAPVQARWVLIVITWILCLGAALLTACLVIQNSSGVNTPFGLVSALAVYLLVKTANQMPLDALYWLVAGGIFYLVGMLCYKFRRLAYHHVIWHLLVIGGSACHLVVVFKYAAPILHAALYAG